MEKFDITIANDRKAFHFEVVDQEKGNSEFEVYENGTLVSTFGPNDMGDIEIFLNQGGLDEEIVDMIADRIEQHHL